MVEPSGWIHIPLLDLVNNPIRTFMIQIAVLANHQNGRDTHMRQIKVYTPVEESSIGKFPRCTTVDFMMYRTIRWLENGWTEVLLKDSVLQLNGFRCFKMCQGVFCKDKSSKFNLCTCKSTGNKCLFEMMKAACISWCCITARWNGDTHSSRLVCFIQLWNTDCSITQICRDMHRFLSFSYEGAPLRWQLWVVMLSVSLLRKLSRA